MVKKEQAAKPPRSQRKAEEIALYDRSPEYFAQKFDEARHAGQLKRLSELKLPLSSNPEFAPKPSGAAPTITIRIQEEDLERARLLAQIKGLKYQTYLKMGIHEYLEREYARLLEMEKSKGFQATYRHDPQIKANRYTVLHFFDRVMVDVTYDEALKQFREMGVSDTVARPALVQATPAR